MRFTSVFLAASIVAQAASACPADAIDSRLAAADEHLFWTEFWADLDAGEADRELGYAIDDLRRAEALTVVESCNDDTVSRMTSRIVRQRLAACLRLHRAEMTGRAGD